MDPKARRLSWLAQAVDSGKVLWPETWSEAMLRAALEETTRAHAAGRMHVGWDPAAPGGDFTAHVVVERPSTGPSTGPCMTIKRGWRDDQGNTGPVEVLGARR